MGDNRGILYIAFGERYKQEARRSLLSVRRASPTLRVAIVTDAAWIDEPRPDIFVLRSRIESFACKPEFMTETPFTDTLFLDTDTVVVRDLEPAFGLLKHYDIGVQFGGPQLNEPDGLELHTQCNSGVILFRRGDAVWDVMKAWKRLYAEAETCRRGRDVRGLNDQRYLSIAIARSAVRPVHLASYLNFPLFTTIVTYSPPVVLHGRLAEMEILPRWISDGWDNDKDSHPRLWIPTIRGLLPAGLRRSDPLLALALVARRLWNEIRWRLGAWLGGK